MIRNWRNDFAKADFPFHFVQIAPFNYARGNPKADLTPCAELWDAHLFTLKTGTNTGMAVISDIGNLHDIHSTNKADVGHRIALWALAKDHGKKDLSYSGPIYKNFSFEGDRIKLEFDHAAGLKSPGGKALTHFTIAGEDPEFVAAEATIKETQSSSEAPR
jgi:sialate O-acetylesterase